MRALPVFLSVIVVVRNQADQLQPLLTHACASISKIAQDFELILVDNASEDDSLAVLRRLTAQEGLPNLQVFGLTKEVDEDTASWAGLENALGDFVAVIDPAADDIDFLSTMLDQAVTGADVVFATNEHRAPQSLLYACAFAVFNLLYKWFNGIHLSKEAPHYRLISRRVVNYILQHPHPTLSYRHLPATGGFARVNLRYEAQPGVLRRKRLRSGIDRGMRMLISTTRAPMRLVTTLSLFGAGSNLLYSIYVVAIGLFKSDVAPGWISLSLQQSGMFFLISLVLMVLGEYILNMALMTNEGPPYHVAQEFTSVRMTRREKLNIEHVTAVSRVMGEGRDVQTSQGPR